MGTRFKRTARTALALPVSAALAFGTAGVASAQEPAAPATPASILGVPLPPPPSPEEVGRWIADAQTAVQDGADMLANAAAWVADPTPENANKAIGAFIGAIPDAGQRDLANKLYTDAFNALNGRQQQMAEANSAFQLSNAQFGKESPEAMDARHNVVTIKIQMADAAVDGDEEALEVFSKDGGKEIGQASVAAAGEEAYDQTVSEAKADRKEAKQELRQAKKESSDSGSDSSETAEVGGNEDQRIAELEQKLEDSESRIAELKDQNSSNNNTSTSTSSGSTRSSGSGSSGSSTPTTSSSDKGDDDSGDLSGSGDAGDNDAESPAAEDSASTTSAKQPTTEAASDVDESAKKKAKEDREEAASAFVKANKELSNGIDKYVHEQVRRDDSGGLTGAGGGNDKAFNKLSELQKEEEAKLQALKDAEQAAKDAGWDQKEIGKWSAATTNEIDGHSYDASNRDEVNSSQEYKNLRAAERLRRAGLNGSVVPVICRDGKVRGSDEWSEEEAKQYFDGKAGGSKNFKNLTDEDCVSLEKMNDDGSLEAYMKRVEEQQARSS